MVLVIAAYYVLRRDMLVILSSHVLWSDKLQNAQDSVDFKCLVVENYT